MRKIRKKNKLNITFMIVIYIMILLFISVAYSFFNDSLSIRGKVSFGSTVASDYNYQYSFESSWPVDNMYIHTIDSTLSYTGNENVTGWVLNLWVPSNTEVTGCFNASSCIVNNNTLRITNAPYNGNLNINNPTVVIRTQIKIESSTYDLKLLSVNFIKDNTIVIPNPPDEEYIDNINTTVTLVSDWDTKKYYTIDITNNSAIDLMDFEMKLKIPDDGVISSIWGVDYINVDSTLTVTSPSHNKELKVGSTIQANIMYDSLTLKENKMEIISFVGTTAEGKNVNIKW